ncbi:MAG: ACP S-malonyltransferase [Coleofasciculaceae cyanobacterium]
MTKTAWVFPGQGSQTIGMGVDLRELPFAKVKLEQAKQVLGWDVLEICQSQDDKVSRTLYTQPCLYVIESILADILIERGNIPDLLAGHSLGEYVALYVSRVYDFDAGLHLVKRRAELMDNVHGGTMTALIGFDREQLTAKLQENPNVVLANDNSPAQVVISGTPEAVQDLLTQIKVKKAIPLKVSGAFHSPLMADAAAEFESVLQSVPFSKGLFPILSNVEPSPSNEPEVLKERLGRQMTGSVRWREISLQLPEAGMEKVIEIGPGKVLTGLIKRMCPNLKLENIGSLAELTA